ncbi:major facilitator superfamily transporter [Phlyctema vagabunda]|uniref:Major facilitator superfamily transporter n=1 Tax=Phlyctema vagabunda TaxID=108571 RepID=A0ABR4PPH3_9HELO
MGAGWVLEDCHLSGTIILEDIAESENVTGDLKHGTGKNKHLVLTPQPSDDPNDPLTWSKTRKLVIMLITGMGTILYGAVFGPLLNASLVVIAVDLDVTITDITLLSGYQVLVVGCTAPFVSALSRKYGKRGLFVLSAISAVIGNIVGSTSKNYNQLLAARIIQGLSVSTYESLLLVVIGDLFFVHERGMYTSIVSFLLAAVSNLASVVCGPITNNLGWKYLFHIFIAVSSVQTVCQILFVPETTYRRDKRYETEQLATENLGEQNLRQRTQEKDTAQQSSSRETSRTIPVKKTFRQDLKLFNGSFTDESLVQLLLAPFAVCLNLAVAYIIIVQGCFICLYVAIAFLLAQIFGYPPYSMSPAAIGYLSLGPFIGGLVAVALFAVITDPLILFMAKRNKGIYEPEYRLLIAVLGIATGAGLFAYGDVTQEYGSFYLAATIHAIVIFGVMALTVATSSYALDAYGSMSNEIFIMAKKNGL